MSVTLASTPLSGKTKMTTYLANAFSLNMLSTAVNHYKVDCERLLPLFDEGIIDSESGQPYRFCEVVKSYLDEGFVSAIGHEATAHALEQWLNSPDPDGNCWNYVKVPANRIEVSLKPGDTLIVAQVQGGRLPEGRILAASEIKSFAFWIVTVSPKTA